MHVFVSSVSEIKVLYNILGPTIAALSPKAVLKMHRCQHQRTKKRDRPDEKA